MAEFWIYNKENQKIGLLQDTYSIQWMPRYSETGTAEINARATDDNREMLVVGNYIVHQTRKEICFIENVFIDDFENGGSIRASGRMNQLHWRTNTKTKHLRNTDELMELYTTNRRNLNLAAGSVSFMEFPNIETTWQPIEETFSKVCSDNGIGFRVRHYPKASEPVQLEIYYNAENRNAKFSEELGTIIGQSLANDETDYYNFAYVAGEGEGEERRIYELDLTNGEDRRERYVDARDISAYETDDEGNEIEIPKEEYDSMLRQRGLEDLLEHPRFREYAVQIDTFSSLFQYGKDYELGDLIMTISHKYNIKTWMRISGINIIDEQTETVELILKEESEAATLWRKLSH